MKKTFFKPMLFIAPALLIYLLVIIIPSVWSLYLSFFKWNGLGTMQFVGIYNYTYLFTRDPVFQTALENNLIWTALFLIIPIGIGLLLALVLNRRFKGRVIFRAVFYFPFILSSIVVAEIWEWMFYPNTGVIESVIHSLGLPSGLGWLANPHTALFAVITTAAWQATGGTMVLFLSGLQSIPQEPIEAAIVEGATVFQRFWYVTIPLLRETFVIVISTTIIGALGVFNIVYAMTGGGPADSTQVLATWMYEQMYSFSNLGLGAAISWVLVIITAAIAIPYVTYSSRET